MRYPLRPRLGRARGGNWAQLSRSYWPRRPHFPLPTLPLVLTVPASVAPSLTFQSSQSSQWPVEASPASRAQCPSFPPLLGDPDPQGTDRSTTQQPPRPTLSVGFPCLITSLQPPVRSSHHHFTLVLGLCYLSFALPLSLQTTARVFLPTTRNRASTESKPPDFVAAI